MFLAMKFDFSFSIPNVTILAFVYLYKSTEFLSSAFKTSNPSFGKSPTNFTKAFFTCSMSLK